MDKNVWWPWKNYDDWLTGRGQQKAEQPTTNKKKDKKTRKEKNKGNRRHNKKNGKKKKNPKTGKRHRKTEGDRNSQLLSINSITEDNEVTKKGSITELKYNSLPIDIVLRNNPSIPTLVKYTSRNYTYGMLLFSYKKYMFFFLIRMITLCLYSSPIHSNIILHSHIK